MRSKYGKVIVAGVSLLVIIVTTMFISVMTDHSIRTARAEPVDTYHTRWQLVKTVAAEDGADFAATLDLAGGEGGFANKTSGAFQIRSRSAISSRSEGYSFGGAWIFSFCGVGVENDTFSFNLVGWAKTNGMAQVIAEGDGVLGTQDVVIYPSGAAVTDGFWVDTINLDETTKWPSVAVYNSGDDEVALLVVDMTGLEWVDFITYDALSSQAGEANSVGVYGRGY